MCDDECVIIFDKKISRKENYAKLIEEYQDIMNGLWHLPFYDTYQVNQKYNGVDKNTYPNQNSNKLCQYIKVEALYHPQANLSTSQQELAILYHGILCCQKNVPYYKQSNMVPYKHGQGLKKK